MDLMGHVGKSMKRASFNSLGNTLTDSRSNMSRSLCLLVTLMKQHLNMYTYNVETTVAQR